MVFDVVGLPRLGFERRVYVRGVHAVNRAAFVPVPGGAERVENLHFVGPENHSGVASALRARHVVFGGDFKFEVQPYRVESLFGAQRPVEVFAVFVLAAAGDDHRAVLDFPVCGAFALHAFERRQVFPVEEDYRADRGLFAEGRGDDVHPFEGDFGGLAVVCEVRLNFLRGYFAVELEIAGVFEGDFAVFRREGVHCRVGLGARHYLRNQFQPVSVGALVDFGEKVGEVAERIALGAGDFALVEANKRVFLREAGER